MIRPYRISDKEELVKILKLNIPQYFDEREEMDFIEYLDHHRESYFVFEENGSIKGCGGINYFTDKEEARLSWNIVHPEFQGKGIGKKLTHYRLNEVRKNPEIKDLYVRTTQLVYPFYEKAGFTLDRIEKDFWARGFDLYQMRMNLKNLFINMK